MADPYYSLHPYHPNPNPNPQPPLQGIQPYPSQLSAPPVYAGLQTAYPNPDASHTWVPEQFASVYPIPNAIQPVTETPLPTAGCNTPQMSNWPISYLQSNASKRKPKSKKQLNKMNQSVRCEICDTYCTSIELYEKHVSGKRHLKTIKKKYAPQPTPSQPKQKSAEDSVKVCSTCNVPCSGEKALVAHLAGKRHRTQEKAIAARSGVGIEGAPAMTASVADEDLDAKKQKLMDSRDVEESIIVPSSGQVVCESDGASEHIAGKEHILEENGIATVSGDDVEGAPAKDADEDLDANKQKLMESVVVEQSSIVLGSGEAECRSDVASAEPVAKGKHILEGPTTSTIDGQHDNNGILSVSRTPIQDLGTNKQKLIPCGVVNGSGWLCTACNIVCNSEVVFTDHVAGKKHTAQVQKLSTGAYGSAYNFNPPIPPTTKNPPENIETKRRKMEGSGTSSSSVRVCSLCNVVCNSDIVFNTHLSGQKHATMLKKMAQTSTEPAAAS